MSKITREKTRKAINIGMFFFLFYIFLFATNFLFMPSSFNFNLSNFNGRIFLQEKIRPGTFTIDVPIGEALKWGSDAILSYGEKGVEIWKPDNKIPGFFLHSKAVINNEGFWHYDCRIEGNFLQLKRKINPIPLTMIFIIWGALGFAFYISEAIKIENKYKISDSYTP